MRTFSNDAVRRVALAGLAGLLVAVTACGSDAAESEQDAKSAATEPAVDDTEPQAAEPDGEDAEPATSESASSGEAPTTSESESAEELTLITVGAPPIADAAPLWICIEEGFCADNGLELEIVDSPSGGSGTIPGILSDNAQYGMSAATDAIAAKSNDFDVTIALQMSAGAAEEADNANWLVTLEESGITSVEELEGGTIAIAGLGGLNDTEVKQMLVNVGLDPEAADVVALPFPQMGEALISGRVDAAAMVEPFVTLTGLEAPINRLVGNETAIAPELPAGMLVTTQDYIDNNTDEYDAFRTAIADSKAFARDNPDVVRTLLEQYQGLPSEVSSEVVLPNFLDSTNRDGFQALQDAMVDFGFIDEAIPLDEILAEGA